VEQHAPLPVCIQKLAIHWEYTNGKPALDFGPPDLNGLKNSLVSKYTELRVFWVEGSGVMYFWRKDHGSMQHAYEERESASVDSFMIFR
jgi:hypothetical protein